MHRRAWVIIVCLLLLPGCLSTGGSTQSQDGDVLITSIGQNPAQDGDGVVVQGAVRNDGDNTATKVTIDIELLSGDQVVASQTLPIGTLEPGDRSAFSRTLDVDPDSVDGRRVTVS